MESSSGIYGTTDARICMYLSAALSGFNTSGAAITDDRMHAHRDRRLQASTVLHLQLAAGWSLSLAVVPGAFAGFSGSNPYSRRMNCELCRRRCWIMIANEAAKTLN